MEFEPAVQVWEAAPLSLHRMKQSGLADRYYRTLLKWLPFADKSFAQWEGRPDCGHFFGGSYWYASETAFPAAIFSVLSQIGDYDEAITGISRRELSRKAAMAIRYLGFTHDTGPEDCVRVPGKNPHCSGKKWGGKSETYFMATQNGKTVAQFGLAAWFLWDGLDEESKLLVQNVVASYADRWCDVEPRDGTYHDTQVEENSWVAAGIAIAADMFQNHPHGPAWRAGYSRWAMNALTTFRDRFRNEKVPIHTATLLPDYTAENHGFVHSTYMLLGIVQKSFNSVCAMIAGGEPMHGTLFNNEILYERAIRMCTQSDGFVIPVQGQDWWYNRQHEACFAHAVLHVIHRNSDAARFEHNVLNRLEQIQNSNANGCYIEENGAELTIRAYQTVEDFERRAASDMLMCYLLHAFGGGAVEPSAQSDMLDRLVGVYEFPYGSFIVHRTKTSVSTFSWRNHVMAYTLPNNGLWTVTPLHASMTGSVSFDVSRRVNGLDNEAVVKDTERFRLYPGNNGFAATVSMTRGDGELKQDVAFVSMPDGRSVYIEQIRALKRCSVTRLQTGKIGVRNENYRELREIAPGRKTIYFEDRAVVFEGANRGSDSTRSFPGLRYANVDDQIGYVLYGSVGVSYTNQRHYAKWKGIEDILVLNDRGPIRLAENERLPPFICLSVPNADHRSTAEEAERTVLLACETDLVVLLEIRGYLVYANGQSVDMIATGHRSIRQSSPVPLYEGHNRLSRGRCRWTGKIEANRSGYLPSLHEIKPIDAAAMELDISMLADRIILRNDSPEPARFIWNRRDEKSGREQMELGGKAYVTIDRERTG